MKISKNVQIVAGGVSLVVLGNLIYDGGKAAVGWSADKVTKLLTKPKKKKAA